MYLEHFELPLDSEIVENLNLPRAISCSRAIRNSPFCKEVELRKIIQSKDSFVINDEIIVFDTEVEVPQYSRNDIRTSERIAIIFSQTDKKIPYVFALRKDFPKVTHENLFFKDYPKSLCIYEQSFDDIKISWSSNVFIEDIRTWLKKTAKANLHQDDQQLEPFILFYDGDIILPVDLNPNDKLFVYGCIQKNKKLSLIVSHDTHQKFSSNSFIILILKGNPQIHGIIDFTPRNIEELHDFLLNGNLDLKRELVNFLKEHKGNLNDKLIILIALPKVRNEHSKEIIYENQVYLTFNTIKEIGIQIGLWQYYDNLLADLIDFDIKNSTYNSLFVAALKPHIAYNRNLANQLNNFKNLNTNPKICAIGLGALGSQVFMNLARSGFGQWVLVDDDILFPHNLARHALFSQSLLVPKVLELSRIANELISDNKFSEPIIANTLQLETDEDKKELKEKMNFCDIIFDFSATIAVSRNLVKDPLLFKKRILSSFLNPSGNILVILFEDQEKKLSIDVLEMLFYRELIYKQYLQSFYQIDDSKGIRYSGSCRDKSNRIPQDYMSLHSSIASHIIKEKYCMKEAIGLILYFDSKNYSLKTHNIKISSLKRVKLFSWEIILDNTIIKKLSKLRSSKIPKETGGVLIGSWDVENKKIYVLDTVIPENNLEYPSCFYRGLEGLREKLEKINTLTAGMLKYVGEWHSHPDNCSTTISNDDLSLLSWLTNNMSQENLPALMLIIGENQKFDLYLGEECL